MVDEDIDPFDWIQGGWPYLKEMWAISPNKKEVRDELKDGSALQSF